MTTTDNSHPLDIPAELRRPKAAAKPSATPVAALPAPPTPAVSPEEAKAKRIEMIRLHANKAKDIADPKAAKAEKKVIAKAKRVAKAKEQPKHKPSEIERTEENPQRSIVPMRFKAKYAEHNDSNGDKVALALKAYTETRNADGRPALDIEKLWEVAKANGIDHAKYEGLNNGQKRMNVGNRLRGLLKAGKGVVIGNQRFKDATKALTVTTKAG